VALTDRPARGYARIIKKVWGAAGFYEPAEEAELTDVLGVGGTRKVTQSDLTPRPCHAAISRSYIASSWREPIKIPKRARRLCSPLARPSACA
jgi:hypothetical protein